VVAGGGWVVAGWLVVARWLVVPAVVWQVRWVASQITLALGALHSLNLLHRDIKPSNLVLRGSGYYVLTDFGLSEAPGVSTKTGTRGYCTRSARVCCACVRSPRLMRPYVRVDVRVYVRLMFTC
jgi:hypothetical protein